MPRPCLCPAPPIAAGAEPGAARSVAVILRTRDRPLLLPRALASICAQTHAEWRLYLVNDGGDPAVLEAQLAPHAVALTGRLTLLHRLTPPHGIWHAGQAALDRVTEDLVVLHDDDDSWEPGFLAAATAFLADPGNAGFVAVTTGCTLIAEEITEGVVHERWRCPWPHGRSIVDFRRAIVEAQLPPISLVFRRAATAQVGGFATNLRFLGDWEFLLRLLLVGEIGHVATPLANYHHRLKGAEAAYGNTVVDLVEARAEQQVLLRNAMLRASLQERPEMIGILHAVLGAIAELAERVRQLDESLATMRLVSAWRLKLLRPVRRAWALVLPLRRAVALARGRADAPVPQPPSVAAPPGLPAADAPQRDRAAALEAELAALRTEHAAVLASTSWRITAPLRWLRHAPARLRAG